MGTVNGALSLIYLQRELVVGGRSKTGPLANGHSTPGRDERSGDVHWELTDSVAEVFSLWPLSGVK